MTELYILLIFCVTINVIVKLNQIKNDESSSEGINKNTKDT